MLLRIARKRIITNNESMLGCQQKRQPKLRIGDVKIKQVHIFNYLGRVKIDGEKCDR